MKSSYTKTALIAVPQDIDKSPPSGKPSMVPRIKRPEAKTVAPDLKLQADEEAIPIGAIYDALLISDIAGAVRNVNERSVSLLGYQDEELRKLHIGEIISGIDENLMRSIFKRVKERDFVLIDGYCLRSDGKVFPSETAVSKAVFAGQEHLCFFIRDVSRRQETEQKLQQAVKVKSLHMLAGGVAHDLSNLLTSVIGHLELGMASLPEEARGNADLTAALRDAEKMSALSYRIRAFSGKGILKEASSDLNGIIRDVGARIKQELPANITLEIKPYQSPVQVNAESDLLDTIAENLLVNAVEAVGKDDGVVTISCSIENLEDSFFAEHSMENDLKPGEYACMKVSDTGCGIDDVTRASMFEPFLSTKGAGRGLGLSEVQGIVVVLGGAIAVESEVGKGSTFMIFLPRSDIARAGPVVKPKPETRSAKKAVLVIDDDESIRRYLERVLKLNGFTAFMAENGKQGVERFRAHADEIELVLLDMIMPDETGEKVLQRLRSIRKNIKVLLLTGYTDRMASEMFKAEKPTGVIHKPFSTSDFLNTLKNVFSGDK